MSTYTQELPKGVAQKWRNFAGENAFQTGLDWLRHIHAPSLAGTTPVEKFESAIEWNGYMRALADVEDKLTEIRQVEKPLDEPLLERPGER